MPADSPAPQGPWVSVRAVAWVLDEAPDVPANLIPVLMSLARHADANGRGAWLSKHRLAWNARKTEQQVKRDLRQLRDLGLIRSGDQRLVAHLPADKRPTVYDLALEKRRAAYEPPAGGVAGVPTRTPGLRGSSQGPSRGSSEGQAGGPTRPSGGPSRAPKEDLEKEREKRSPRAKAADIVRETTDATEEETEELLNMITAKFAPDSLAGYVRRMAAEGDLDIWLKQLRAERGAHGVAEEVAQARGGPECPHGEPGGAFPHPQTGGPLCPICRAHQTACKLDALYCPKCQAIREAAGLPPDPLADVP